MAVEWATRPAMQDRLRELWKAGNSASQIARIISSEFLCSISKNSVIGRAHRLGLHRRPSPIRLEGIYGPPTAESWRKSPLRAGRTTLPVLKSLEVPTIAEKTPARGTTPRHPARVFAAVKGMAAIPPQIKAPAATEIVLSKQPCAWPIGEPKQPGFRFCGAPSRAGRPYCPDHCRVAFLPYYKVSGWLRDAEKMPKVP
jgi:GcrA cell cycle regulator